ncbi:glycosyltransferase family 2 protein [Labilibacter sediminis]|nr:glycosyltransferase family 2 protein [Labilibacter sediminis]
MTKLAVVILNWNGEKLLREFLPTVIENSKVPGVDVIVADNASTDHSIQILETEFPTVKIIRLDKNYGFTGGYNRALKQVEAEYIILLNSDIAPGNNWLPPLLKEMDENANTAICVPKIKSYRHPECFEYAGAAGGFIDKYGFPFCRGRIFNQIEEDKGQYNQSGPIFWASGAAMVVRTKLFFESGGLDEDFFAHMEEIDLCWRMKNRGWDVKYIAESEVYHLGGATLDYNNPRKVYLNFRNNLFLLTKNIAKNKLFVKLLQRMIIDGIAAVKFLFSAEFNNFWSVFRAHVRFYIMFFTMYKKRKQNLMQTNHNQHHEMYPGSIVVQFFIKGVRKYSELNNFIR